MASIYITSITYQTLFEVLFNPNNTYQVGTVINIIPI